MQNSEKRGRKLGSTAQKILLLLEAGIILGLTTRPDRYFKVLKDTAREWKRINSQILHENIKRLYRSQLVTYRENLDKTVSLILARNGKEILLRYRLDNMTIPKPARWDGLWRLVIFDIPERLRKGRVALRNKLKELGFHRLQKSVFVFPYECRNEIDFVIEIFELRPYVRYLVVKEIDTATHLKHIFSL